MQPHAGRPHSSPPSSSSRFSPTTTDPSRDVGELLDAADERRFQDSLSALTPLLLAYEAMTSRIGVPRFTRMTVISPVFLLCARTVIMPSSPDDGAAADGRLLVDVTEFVLLVTEFLLSFVGTLAGLKLSSDIAACSQRAQRFQSLSAKGVTRGDIGRGRRRSGLVAARTSLGATQFKNPTAPLIERQPINWAAPNLFFFF